MKRDKLDALFSTIIRFRDRYKCSRCNKVYPSNSAGLHCSHHVPRTFKRLRWNPLNASALCYPCHMWYGGEPYESAGWLAEHLGPEKHAELMRQKQEPFKLNKTTKEDIYTLMKKDRKGQEEFGPEYVLTDYVAQLRADGIL